MLPAIINLLVVLLVVGVILWLINTYLPLDPLLKGIINAVIVLFLIIWLLYFLGFLPERGLVR
jgi:hypothetical protein